MIYLDHHVTTPVDPRVIEAMLPFFTERFGNAASTHHGLGWDASDADLVSITAVRPTLKRVQS